MPLRRYELVSQWLQNKLLAYNGNRLLALKSFLTNSGFYTKQEVLDSPQDVRLQTVDNLNLLSIARFIKQIGDDINNLNTNDRILDEDLKQEIDNKITSLGNSSDPLITTNIYYDLDGTTPATQKWSMSNYKIRQLSDPEDDQDGVTKKYLDTEINIAKQYITNYVYSTLYKRDGSALPTANHSMGDKRITNLADPENSQDAVNKQSAITEIDDAVNNIDTTPYVKRDGSRAMTGDLNANGYRFVGCGTAVNPQDAVNKAQYDAYGAIGIFKGMKTLDPNDTDPQMAFKSNDQYFGVAYTTAFGDGWRPARITPFPTEHSFSDVDDIGFNLSDIEVLQMTDDNDAVINIKPSVDRDYTKMRIKRNHYWATDGRPINYVPLRFTVQIGDIRCGDVSSGNPNYFYAKVSLNALEPYILERCRSFFQDLSLGLDDIYFLKTTDVRFSSKMSGSLSSNPIMTMGHSITIKYENGHLKLEGYFRTPEADWSNDNEYARLIMWVNINVFKK